jgi:hypothetical protein
MAFFKICNKCYQQEHKNDCIDLKLSNITISLETSCPLSVIYHILKNSNINIVNLTSNNLSSVNLLNTENTNDLLETASTDAPSDALSDPYDDTDESYFKKLVNFKNKEEFIAHYGNKNFKQNLYNDCQDVLKQNVNLSYYLNCINSIYTLLYPNEHTKENLFVKLRKSLWKPDSIEYKLSLDILKIAKEVKKQQIEDYQEKVEKNNTEKKIFSYRSLMKILDGLKNGKTKEEMFLFCLLQSGQRPADFFQNNIEKFSDNEIIVSNIAKKRKEDVDVTCIRKLINCSTDEFIRIRNQALYGYKDTKIYNEDNQINTSIMTALNDCFQFFYPTETCLLYTSDAADD